MSDPGSDHEQKSNAGDGPETELTTDGAISLFTSALNNALEKQKTTLIEHFETRFTKSSTTGIESAEFTFKSEDNKIQFSFNYERFEKLSAIETVSNLTK